MKNKHSTQEVIELLEEIIKANKEVTKKQLEKIIIAFILELERIK